MRRYLIAFLALCIASVCYADPEIIHIKQKTPAAGGGGTTQYFGNNQTSTDSDNSPSQYSYTQAFTCPGTGSQTVNSIEIYASGGVSPWSNFRLAILDTSRNLICQWSAEISINSTTAQWWGGAQGLTGTTTLTGGTQYLLALTGDDTDAKFFYTTGTFYYGATDYTSGFPATLAAGTSYAELPCIRVKVTGSP